MVIQAHQKWYASCKKSDSGTDNSYPKQVSITYKVSSTTTNDLVSITYDNETGGRPAE